MASHNSTRKPDFETGRQATACQATNCSMIEGTAAVRAVYLLCGGASRRMGRDKALLPFGRSTMLEHQIGKCGDSFSEIVLLSGTRSYPVDLRHLPDSMEDAGPLSGLLAALEDPAMHSSSAHTCRTLALMAVDLPEVTDITLRYLATGVIPNAHDALIAEPDASGEELRRQPLLGIYDRGIAPRLREYLQAGRRSVQGFLGQIRTAPFKVSVAEICNCNTETEYRMLTNRF